MPIPATQDPDILRALEAGPRHKPNGETPVFCEHEKGYELGKAVFLTNQNEDIERFITGLRQGFDAAKSRARYLASAEKAGETEIESIAPLVEDAKAAG